MTRDWSALIGRALAGGPGVALLHRGEATRVLAIQGPDPLVVRLSDDSAGDCARQAKLADLLYDDDLLTARIHYWEMRQVAGRLRAIQVQDLLPGVPLSAYPTPDEASAIIDGVGRFSARLAAAGPDIQRASYSCFADPLLRCAASDDDPGTRRNARALLDHPGVASALQAKPILTHLDLWPPNILLDKHGDVHLVDLYPLVWAPSALQPIVLMMCCFETLAKQYGPGEAATTLDTVLASWPESVPLGDARLLQALLPVVLALQIARATGAKSSSTPTQWEAAAEEARLWVAAVAGALGVAE